MLLLSVGCERPLYGKHNSIAFLKTCDVILTEPLQPFSFTELKYCFRVLRMFSQKLNSMFSRVQTTHKESCANVTVDVEEAGSETTVTPVLLGFSTHEFTST